MHLNPHVTDRKRGWIRGGLTMLGVLVVSWGIIFVGADYANRQRDAATRLFVRELDKRQAELSAATARKLRAGQLGGCRRDNTVREGLNDTTRTQLAFLRAAKQARQRAVVAATTEADRALNQAAVTEYQTLIKHQHLVPIVDCDAEFPDPTILPHRPFP